MPRISSLLKQRVVWAALGLAGMVALTGCGEASTSGTATATTGTGSTGSSQGGVREVTIVAKDDLFEPKTYTVGANVPVRLIATNGGQNVHEVEVVDLLPESRLTPGQSKTVDLESIKPGTYRIYCEIHEDAGMEGELVVK